MRIQTLVSFLIAFVVLLSSFGTARAFQRTQQSSATTISQSNQQTQPTSNTALAYTLPPALLAKAKTLTRLRAILAFGGTAWTIFVLLLVLALRWPVYLRDWVERITTRRWLQGLIFLPIAILFLVLIPLPFAVYGEHVERVYGISIQPWAGWAGDFGKSAALSIVVFTPLLLLLFWIIRRAPRQWWFWFWLCAVFAVVCAVFIAPIWVDPMFNHFSPLEKSDPALVVRLEKLAHHAGLDIPPSRMFLMQASAKTTGYNAYVTGIGASKRIVVWDNTARKLPPDEVLFIVGHEMGHYVLDHIYKGLVFAALSMLGLLWLAYLAAGWLVRRCRGRWRVRALDDWAALAVLALVATVISFLYMPAANAFSRWEEHQADVFGQEAIHGLVANPQQTAVDAFNALGRTYLEAPNPSGFVEVWLYTHPSISHRADFAAHYDPWLPKRHPRYFQK